MRRSGLPYQCFEDVGGGGGGFACVDVEQPVTTVLLVVVLLELLLAFELDLTFSHKTRI